jgi:Uma2 family endonuclease
MIHDACNHPVIAMTESTTTPLPDGLEPAWDVARLFPPQGSWSEDEYLHLPGNHLTEFDHGRIEVLEMPSELHQLLVAALYRALLGYIQPRNLGVVLFAPFPVKLWEGKLREPDLLFMRLEHAGRRHENHWLGADLVMEVISPGDRRRDTETKRREYALAGIPEYWLVDPDAQSIRVLLLDTETRTYLEHGVFSQGDTASSPTLPGFELQLIDLFAAEA